MTPLEWRGQLSHLDLYSESPSVAADFYVDHLGMARDLQATESDGRVLLGWGLGDSVLELVPGHHTGLEHFAIEISEPAEPDHVRERLERHGVAILSVANQGRHPDGFAAEDPDGRRVEFHGRIDRTGERAASLPARPRRLQHITLASPTQPDAVDFYASVLGMRVSDHIGDVFTWLRCGIEHHTVAIVQSDAPGLIDHLSFDLDCWDAFRPWCDRLGAAGIEVSWGPGRHGPGNNLFIMLRNATATTWSCPPRWRAFTMTTPATSRGSGSGSHAPSTYGVACRPGELRRSPEHNAVSCDVGVLASRLKTVLPRPASMR